MLEGREPRQSYWGAGEGVVTTYCSLFGCVLTIFVFKVIVVASVFR